MPLAAFATGVTIITTEAGDGRMVGMTANSFNSVSLDPALVLWSIGRDANCFEDFISTKSFAIHVLAADQEELPTALPKVGPTNLPTLTAPKAPPGHLYCPTTAPALTALLSINMTVETM